MIKSGLAVGSGLIFLAIALYIGNKKESFMQEEDDKYKILLENVY